MDRTASMIRWIMFTLGMVLIWLGWPLPFAKAVWDTLMVIAGSAIVLLFVYFPDLAYYGQQGLRKLRFGGSGRDGEN
jgi:hypothetical protein